jgi:hypothetical protein
MTKAQLVELIRLSLPLDHNPVLVEKYITIAYNSFVKKYFNENGFQTELFTKEYLNIDVLRNDTTELYYLNLPAQILNVSRPGSGVYSIDASETSELVFSPLSDRGYKVLSDLAVLKVSGVIPFTVIGRRVEFRKELIQIKKVNLRLLVSFDAYEDDDELSTPSDTDIKIRDLVFSFISQHMPPDMVIDANEKTR